LPVTINAGCLNKDDKITHFAALRSAYETCGSLTVSERGIKLERQFSMAFAARQILPRKQRCAKLDRYLFQNSGFEKHLLRFERRYCRGDEPYLSETQTTHGQAPIT
jgi:hypothetical protein